MESFQDFANTSVVGFRSWSPRESVNDGTIENISAAQGKLNVGDTVEIVGYGDDVLKSQVHMSSERSATAVRDDVSQRLLISS